MKTVLITGASGFIGSALVRAFSAKGWRVVGAGRTRPPVLPDGVEWRTYDLALTSLPLELLDGIDAIVHGAVVRQSVDPNSYDVNVAAGKLLLAEARRRHITSVTYLSSLAAHDGALSQYGKHKFVLERHYADRGALVVRPGLVLGNGGLFASMCEYLRSHRVVPLIGGGAQPLQTAYIDDLTDEVTTAVEQDHKGVFTAAEIEPVTYRRFYEELCASLGAKPIFVPIPFWAAEFAVATAELLHMQLPIDRDNLLGLKTMRQDTGAALSGLRVKHHRSNIERALAAGE